MLGRLDIAPLGTDIAAAQLCAYTVVDPALRSRIVARCVAANTPSIALLDPLINGLGALLGATPSGRPGRQYNVDAGYFDRITALDFAIANDDGNTRDHLLSADVILTGVSRTSKTPTCVYLAYQGIKAANVPLTPSSPEPSALLEAISAGVPVIGLIASASRLMHIRQTRLNALDAHLIPEYSSREGIEDELVRARLFFERHALPVIDVTRRSIEETAASVRHYLSKGTK